MFIQRVSDPTLQLFMLLTDDNLHRSWSDLRVSLEHKKRDIIINHNKRTKFNYCNTSIFMVCQQQTVLITIIVKVK